MKIRKHELAILVLGFLLAVVVGILSWPVAVEQSIDQFLITEVMIDNQATFQDPYGEFSDYIECYNGTESPIDLSEYYLSDSNKDIEKWQLPSVKLGSKEYVVFYATGMGSASHTNFKLDARGEGLILSNKKGIVQELVVEGSSPDISYGYNNEKKQYTYFIGGTPGKINDGYALEDIESFVTNNKVQFSLPSGFYEDENQVTLSTALKEGVVHYTLDGSEPTVDSPIAEEGIVVKSREGEPNHYANNRSASYYAKDSGDNLMPDGPVSKGTIIRGKVFINDIPVSKTFTETYFVFKEGAKRYSFPVVSLTTDPMNLFDKAIGIYCLGNAFDDFQKKNPTMGVDGSTPANYNQEGPKWERPANFTYFVDGVKVFSQDIGISTMGNWSRANIKKSFKIKASSNYETDKNTIEYPLIPNAVGYDGEIINRFKNVALRSGANDFEYVVFRDEMIQSLAGEAGVSIQGYQPVVLFLDGEYWGIYYIKEVQDRHYITAHFPVKAADVVIIVNEGELYEGSEVDVKDYEDTMAFFEEADLTDEAQYAKATELVDIDNFINYYLSEIYAANTDWPGNNIKVWKGNMDAPKEMQKWRYLLYDTDFGFELYQGLQSSANSDTLKLATDPFGAQWPNPPWSTLLLRKFLENETFRNKFVNRQADLLNSTFKSDNVVERIESFRTLLTPEMDENIRRYQTWPTPDMAAWNDQVDHMLDFAKTRPNYLRRYTVQHFAFEGTADILLDYKEDHGSVQINTITLEPSEEVEKLVYYQGVPINLKVVPDKGYEAIVKLEGKALTGEEWQLSLVESQTLEITFEKK